jgi:hypothetical protein
MLRLWNEVYLRYDRIYFQNAELETVNGESTNSLESSQFLGVEALDIKVPSRANSGVGDDLVPEEREDSKVTEDRSDSEAHDLSQVQFWMRKSDATSCKACQRSFSVWRKKRHCYQWYVFDSLYALKSLTVVCVVDMCFVIHVFAM